MTEKAHKMLLGQKRGDFLAKGEGMKHPKIGITEEFSFVKLKT